MNKLITIEVDEESFEKIFRENPEQLFACPEVETVEICDSKNEQHIMYMVKRSNLK